MGARTHAAAKEREDAADGLDMRETDTMGGGDNFQEMLAFSKNNRQRRETAKEVWLCYCRCALVCLDFISGIISVPRFCPNGVSR